VGETVVDPSNGTIPIPLLIYANCPFVELQVRVADPPCSIIVGDEIKLTTGTFEESLTVTVTLPIEVPPGPVAVIV